MKELKIKNINCRLIAKNDPEVNKLAKRLEMNEDEIEDLLEEQRPNILNFENYSIITMLFPTQETIKNGEFLLQLTFVITKNEINIIANKEHEYLTKAFEEVKEIKTEGKTGIISEIIDTVREESIKTFDKFDDYLDEKEKEIIQGKRDKKLMITMHNLKETLYYTLRTVQGNTTVIKELLQNKIKMLNPKYFSEHQEDRALFFEDLIELLRESVSTNIETYASLITQQLNERIYKLTIISAIMLIPAMISGFFGMNMPLPNINFYGVIGISAITAFITYWIIK
ncbi:MAG TPA: magnesium transporter CorA family protein [Candidatus Nanoarchaeia archaeon]|nr:magnesium transporter CorA family protein [Candidatus Nanoarchaeia archaeon]